MLQFFRKLAQSKIGLGIMLGFLVLLMVSFAAGDISKFWSGGGAQNAALATIAGTEVTERDVRLAADNTLQTARERQPGVTMKQLLAGGGFEDLIGGLVDKAALLAFGKDHDLGISDALVSREISQINAFRGPDGSFSEALYRQLLQQRGITEAALRQDIASSLASKQILVPAAFGAGFPEDMATRYMGLLREQRQGAIALLPSAAFAPPSPPSDAELQAFYTKHRQDYVRPERRVIRYAVFGEDAVKNVPAPTDGEISARYQANIAQYRAAQTRRITQLVLPTEAAARAVLAEVRGGKTLEQAASTKGLSAGSIGEVTREALTSQSSAAVAEASFTAARGALVGPVRGSLGWHLMRIDAITDKPGKTLEQARGEIAGAISQEKKRKALNDFAAEVEGEFENGGSLGDVAKQIGVEPQSTEPLIADGTVFGKPGEKAPAVLEKVVGIAFSMEGEGKPQLAEIEPGKSFMIFEAGSVTPEAPAPLAEIRETVLTDYALQAGVAKARQAADRLADVARKGGDIGQAMAGLGATLPPVDRISMTREQLMRSQQQIPPPLQLLFAMAKGTVKLLPAPRNRGWYVVQLKDITPGEAPANPELAASARRELGQSAGREYAEQLRAAIRDEVGVERNEPALQALLRSMTGGN